MLVQLSSHLNFHLMLQFQQHCNKTAEISAQFFKWLTLYKLEAELSSQKKVMEGTVDEETLVERALVAKFK